MPPNPPPPETYEAFKNRFPIIARAWDAVSVVSEEGPLDPRVARLIKLGIAIGAQREGAVHASVRKGIAMGIPRDELEQVVALAASTIGFPPTVAAFSWVRETLEGDTQEG